MFSDEVIRVVIYHIRRFALSPSSNTITCDVLLVMLSKLVLCSMNRCVTL